MFALMFEFIYYVSVIWWVKLDFDGGLSYGSKMKWGQTGRYQFMCDRFLRLFLMCEKAKYFYVTEF